jgi:hypothetical protein
MIAAINSKRSQRKNLMSATNGSSGTPYRCTTKLGGLSNTAGEVASHSLGIFAFSEGRITVTAYSSGSTSRNPWIGRECHALQETTLDLSVLRVAGFAGRCLPLLKIAGSRIGIPRFRKNVIGRQMIEIFPAVNASARAKVFAIAPETLAIAKQFRRNVAST